MGQGTVSVVCLLSVFFFAMKLHVTQSLSVNMPKHRSLYSGWGEVTEVAESSGMYFGVILCNIYSVILCKELIFFGTRMAKAPNIEDIRVAQIIQQQQRSSTNHDFVTKTS